MLRIITEEFRVADTLNPKLFNTNTDILLPEVREKLIDIVKYFENYIEVPIRICDVQLVGSQMGWTYTDSSDLDIHLIADFEIYNQSSDVLQLLYSSKQSEFNSKFNITIKSIPVEIYIQDIRSSTISNGIYSLCDNDWIKKPKPYKSITKPNVEKELKKWIPTITNSIDSGNSGKMQDALNAIYLIRHNSLTVDGEMGKGNILFKELRRLGYIQKLKDALNSIASKELSLEGLKGWE